MAAETPAISGFNISGNDWLGIGQWFSASASSKTHAECGKKPSCWIGNTCQEKKQQYQDCIDRSTAQKGQTSQTNAEANLEDARNKKFLYIAVGLALLFALIFMLRR